MRLIDADKLEPDTEWSNWEDAFCSYSKEQINNAETINVERYGYFEHGYDDFWHCSECGNKILSDVFS